MLPEETLTPDLCETRQATFWPRP